MRKLLPIFLMLLLAVSCDDKECEYGYEGGDCEQTLNSKFAGNYNTDYEGTGGLSGSDGVTIAKVSMVPNRPDKILIEVELGVNASVLGQSIAVPLDVEIEATVDGDTYYIPSTTINTEVQGLPITLNWEVEGALVGENQLNSTLTMTGALSGTIEMEGTK